MILYLIRHAQSTNNFLADRLRSQGGLANPEVLEHYMLTRDPDPPLSDIGFQQAELLARFLQGARPKHRAGIDDVPDQAELAAEVQALGENPMGITRLYVSPMLRTLQTAEPVARALGIRPPIWIDIHEHGGIFMRQPQGGSVGHPGLGRQAIQERFPDYELDPAIREEGWWFGAEEDRPTCDARAVRVAATLHRWASEYPQERIALITHGTFLDSLVKALLERLPGLSFHVGHYNTGITRLDFTTSHEDGRPFLVVRYTNRVDHLPPELIT